MIIYYSIKNCPSDLLRGISTKFWLRSYFLYFFFLISIHANTVAIVAHKRKIYDSRSTNKSANYSYNSHKYHHHCDNNEYASTSATYPRRANRFAGFTLRGLFEPTPFYRFFGRTHNLYRLYSKIESIMLGCNAFNEAFDDHP